MSMQKEKAVVCCSLGAEARQQARYHRQINKEIFLIGCWYFLCKPSPHLTPVITTSAMVVCGTLDENQLFLQMLEQKV